ncbi:MAG: hypothetical protein JXR49_08010, partial [Acidobacteria bacterium]|nr:hypothetical protein [Acidobacteriota bacterium]
FFRPSRAPFTSTITRGSFHSPLAIFCTPFQGFSSHISLIKRRNGRAYASHTARSGGFLK